jgi:murein DD-endopeptidase MepM/ murein hydrolase activator NlpD
VSHWKKKRERLWRRILAKFPVRQIYFRTNGRVRFVSVVPWVQMTGLTIATVSLIWVGVTTFHYLARDIILEQREATIRTMATQYDVVTDDMVSLQNDILERASRLEERQRYLEGLIGATTTDSSSNGVVEVTRRSGTAAGSATNAPVETQAPPSSNDQQANLQATEELRGEVLGRFASVEDDQVMLARTLLAQAEDRFVAFNSQLSETALDSESLINNWTGPSMGTASGGPFVPPLGLRPLAGEVAASGSFLALADELNTQFTRLQQLNDAIASLPISEPADEYYVSSHFGPRTDPIRGVPAIHPGLDMAGWPGTNIRATAPGVVTKAGPWGPYGNLVEIDHGNGFKTRYGHMRRVKVRVGQQVTREQQVGEMGCTGRCTGTHLHYEIWFGGRLQDPLPLIKVSENVLQIER